MTLAVEDAIAKLIDIVALLLSILVLRRASRTD